MLLGWRNWVAFAAGCGLANLAAFYHSLLPYLGLLFVLGLLTLTAVASQHYRDYLANMGKTTHDATDRDMALYLALRFGVFLVLGGAGASRAPTSRRGFSICAWCRRRPWSAPGRGDRGRGCSCRRRRAHRGTRFSRGPTDTQTAADGRNRESAAGALSSRRPHGRRGSRRCGPRFILSVAPPGLSQRTEMRGAVFSPPRACARG